MYVIGIMQSVLWISKREVSRFASYKIYVTCWFQWPRLVPPTQELFQKHTIENYILYDGGNCISTVLYCVVIHMRSKVYSLCVNCYISGIL